MLRKIGRMVAILALCAPWAFSEADGAGDLFRTTGTRADLHARVWFPSKELPRYVATMYLLGSDLGAVVHISNSSPSAPDVLIQITSPLYRIIGARVPERQTSDLVYSYGIFLDEGCDERCAQALYQRLTSALKSIDGALVEDR